MGTGGGAAGQQGDSRMGWSLRRGRNPGSPVALSRKVTASRGDIEVPGGLQKIPETIRKQHSNFQSWRMSAHTVILLHKKTPVFGGG